MDVDRGAIWIAEASGRRCSSLVLSNSSFTRRYRRVLLAPDAAALTDEPRRPGWVGEAGAYFDVSRIVTVPVDRVLEHQGTVPSPVVLAALRIMHEALR